MKSADYTEIYAFCLAKSIDLRPDLVAGWWLAAGGWWLVVAGGWRLALRPVRSSQEDPSLPGILLG